MIPSPTRVPKPIRYPETVEGMTAHLRASLAHIMPDAAIRRAARTAVEVNELKQSLNAIILGHNYMEPALYHSVPDYTGDSLGLSRISAQADADIIVFCGVRFMAATAKILNPSRTVLLPTAKGGCSLAEAITAEDVRRLRTKYPGRPIVTYVNTYAEVKAESDYCCTSGNATAIVTALREQGHDEIIFLPDEYLAANTAAECGMAFYVESRVTLRNGNGAARDGASDQPSNCGIGRCSENGSTIIGWAGRCEVHERFDVSDIRAARAQYADVLVLAHPECSPEVIAESDFSGSTTQMLKKVDETPRGHLLLLTECSMADNIASRSPEREIIRTCSIRCPHMNEITLEETLAALQQKQHEIEVDAAVASRARVALDRMIATG